MKNVSSLLRSRAARVAALTVATTAVGAAGGVASAQAATCGSGYSLIGHKPVYNDMTNQPEVMGYLDIYYSGSTRRNCAVLNHSSKYWGVPIRTDLGIRPWSSTGSYAWSNDTGVYSYYAGPVYTPRGLDMSHRCIDVGGAVGSSSKGTWLWKAYCG